MSFICAYRQLAKISRSTRGIVLLLCDLDVARRIMSEATRLKMTGGHFIWIWADTSSTAEFFQPFDRSNEEKDQKNTKVNYNEYMSHKQTFDSFNSRQYYQNQPATSSNRRNNNNNNNKNQTKYKAANSNRFHHIIGLNKQKTGDDESFMADDDDDTHDHTIMAAAQTVNFRQSSNKLRAQPTEDQVPLKDKRKDKKKFDAAIQSNSKKVTETSSSSIESDKNKLNAGSQNENNDYVSSIESERNANKQLNIKNINSNEFNANYYDPHSPYYGQNQQNKIPDMDEKDEFFGSSEFDDSSDEESNVYYDYDKTNPFQTNVPAKSTTAQPPSSIRTPATTTATRRSSDDKSNKHKNNYNTNTQESPHSKAIDDGDDLDLENYSENINDSKSKRADTSQPAFNISSHVFFHHFKDFPVGLLALRHIKMNIDRVFVRSAIRLFASTWARVERIEEMRLAVSSTSSSASGGRKNTNYDYDNYGETTSYNRGQNKVKNKVHVNNRYSLRGSKKFRRNAQAQQSSPITIANTTSKTLTDNEKSILTLVNSSRNSTYFTNTKLIRKVFEKSKIKSSEHVSGLNTQQMHSSDVEIKSNIDKISNSSYNSSASRSSIASQLEISLVALQNHSETNEGISIQKRQPQNSWWSPNNARSSNSASNIKNNNKMVGTPQYKGGCFGAVTRNDLKRSEVFSR